MKVGKLPGSSATKMALHALDIVDSPLQGIFNINMADLMTAADNRTKIAAIKLLYDTGEISREEAKRLAQPIIDRINRRTMEIAIKHGQKPYRLDFVSVMRNSY